MDQIERAIKDAGGPAAVAARLQVSIQRLSNWTTRGVPVEFMRPLEAATGNRVRCWHVFPTTWHRIWPELVGSEGAPPVPDSQPARAA